MSKIFRIKLKNEEVIDLNTLETNSLDDITRVIATNQSIHDGKVGVMTNEISTFELIEVEEIKEEK